MQLGEEGAVAMEVPVAMVTDEEAGMADIEKSLSFLDESFEILATDNDKTVKIKWCLIRFVCHGERNFFFYNGCAPSKAYQRYFSVRASKGNINGAF